MTHCVSKGAYLTESTKAVLAGRESTCTAKGKNVVAAAIAEGRVCARTVDEYLEGYANL